MSERFNELFNLVDSLRDDDVKSSNGNKAAARRLRKNLMKVKTLAHQFKRELSPTKPAKE